MASIFLDASQTTNVTRTSEGNQKQVRGLRDGALVTADWAQALVLEGRVHGAQTGTGGSPDTFNVTYTDARQDFYLFVPAGTVILPLYIGIVLEDTATAAAMDCFVGYSTNGDSVVAGTGLTIYNFKTLASPTSACTATGVVTSGGTTHLGGTDFLEFWRPFGGNVADNFNAPTSPSIGGQYSPSGAHWSYKQYVAPVIGTEGTACALSIFASASGGTGFLTVVWAELPASALA